MVGMMESVKEVCLVKDQGLSFHEKNNASSTGNCINSSFNFQLYLDLKDVREITWLKIWVSNYVNMEMM